LKARKIRWNAALTWVLSHPVSDAIYGDPRLAPLYDEFEDNRADLLAYVAFAEALNAELVLDIGCGTGTLAVLLARSGRTVVAVDPAQASLEVAKAKGASLRITWLHGHAADVPEIGADLAVMTGNVAQALVTDYAWTTTLASAHRALRPGGHFVFETRRPARRAWQDWAADTETEIRDIAGIGRVARRFEVTAIQSPVVSFRYTYTFGSGGDVLVSESTLRFREREDIEADLIAHGFRVHEVRDAPDRPGEEFVFIAEKISGSQLA
jgi:SAM-dependent methyltransferase